MREYDTAQITFSEERMREARLSFPARRPRRRISQQSEDTVLMINNDFLDFQLRML